MSRKQRQIGQQGQRRSARSVQGAAPSSASHVMRLKTLALKHHRSGRFGQAERYYRAILAIQPNDIDGMHLLGVIAHQTGRNELAVQLIGNALALNDKVPVLHYNIARALRVLDRTDDAIAHFRRAIDLKPDDLEALCTLGNIFQEQGELEKAVECYHAALAARPDCVEARIDLRIRPDYAEVHVSLGNVLNTQGKLDEAVAHYRQALALSPDNAQAHNNLGNALRSQGRSDEAAEALHQALALKPNYAVAYHNLANALRDVGKFEEARVASEKAIELSPANLAFHYGLAISKHFQPGDRQLEVLETIAADEGSLSMEDRILLHFALAKRYDTLGDHERSFARLVQGNSLKRQQIAYNKSATLARFDRIRSVFTFELMRERSMAGHGSSLPVFIIGMPRSGTTLVEQILASHPMVFGAGELRNMADATRQLQRLSNFGLCFPEIVPSLTDAELRQFGASYIDSISTFAPTAERVTDKMPSNFELTGLIHLTLPNARIIHVRRDPLDTCVSCFSTLFAETEGYAYTFDLAELGRFHGAYQELMEHWRRVLPPGTMLEVQYEQVVADVEGEAGRIVSHCGLGWDDACLSFHDTERSVRTASAVQVRQPIYRSSIGRWRAYEHLLGPLIEALGVDLTGSDES